MLVGAVRVDLVDDDLEPERMRAFGERIEVAERAEHRVYSAIICDVITEVAHWRDEEGRQPDRVHPEAADIIELAGDSSKVADAVAVRVGKAARVDLVDRRALPPWGSGPGRCCLLGFSEHCTPRSRAAATRRPRSPEPMPPPDMCQPESRNGSSASRPGRSAGRRPSTC